MFQDTVILEILAFAFQEEVLFDALTSPPGFPLISKEKTTVSDPFPFPSPMKLSNIYFFFFYRFVVELSVLPLF